jgi:thiol-disulfide isomerase/thioredoxin
MRKTIITMTVIAALLLLSGCGPAKNYDEFAKCLTAENMTMYGAFWCGHCNKVKEEFGNSFRFINYVECDPNGPGADPERCARAVVQYYPTFIFKDGNRLFGEVSFSILSQKTGCGLP